MPDSIVKYVQSELNNKTAAIKKLLPAVMKPERYIHSATVVISASESLQKCEKTSLVRAVIDAAAMGLDFYPAKGLAYLIARGGKAKFEPSYKGLVFLTVKSKRVMKIEARTVYAKEKFEVCEGTKPEIIHIPVFDKEKRGDKLCVYAVAFFREGDPQFEVMDLHQIEHVMNKTSSKKSGKIVGPWINDREEMEKKTVVRRLIKLIPLGDFEDDYQERFEKALESDNEGYDLGNDEDDIPEMTDDKPEKKTKTKPEKPEKSDPKSEPEDAQFEDVPEGEEEPEKKTKPEKPEKPEPKTEPETDSFWTEEDVF